MKTLTIEIPENKTEKMVIELLAKHGIALANSKNKTNEPSEVSKKLSKTEQDYEDKVDRNIALSMQDVDLSVTVKESTVMRNLRK